MVGQKGKTINEIIARTDVKIDITDEGAVSVCGTDKEKMAEAIDMIKTITTDFEEGQIFTGTVVSIKELVHLSSSLLEKKEWYTFPRFPKRESIV